MYVSFKKSIDPFNTKDKAAKRKDSKKKTQVVGVVFDSEYIAVANEDILSNVAQEDSIRNDKDGDISSKPLTRSLKNKHQSYTPRYCHKTRYGSKLALDVISQGLGIHIKSEDELCESECRSFDYEPLPDLPINKSRVPKRPKQVPADDDCFGCYKLTCDVYPNKSKWSREEEDEKEFLNLLYDVQHDRAVEIRTQVAEEATVVGNYKLTCDVYNNAPKPDDEEINELECCCFAYECENECKSSSPKSSIANRLKQQIFVYNVSDGTKPKTELATKNELKQEKNMDESGPSYLKISAIVQNVQNRNFLSNKSSKYEEDVSDHGIPCHKSQSYPVISSRQAHITNPKTSYHGNQRTTMPETMLSPAQSSKKTEEKKWLEVERQMEAKKRSNLMIFDFKTKIRDDKKDVKLEVASMTSNLVSKSSTTAERDAVEVAESENHQKQTTKHKRGNPTKAPKSRLQLPDEFESRCKQKKQHANKKETSTSTEIKCSVDESLRRDYPCLYNPEYGAELCPAYKAMKEILIPVEYKEYIKKEEDRLKKLFEDISNDTNKNEKISSKIEIECDYEILSNESVFHKNIEVSNYLNDVISDPSEVMELNSNAADLGTENNSNGDSRTQNNSNDDLENKNDPNGDLGNQNYSKNDLENKNDLNGDLGNQNISNDDWENQNDPNADSGNNSNDDLENLNDRKGDSENQNNSNEDSENQNHHNGDSGNQNNSNNDLGNRNILKILRTGICDSRSPKCSNTNLFCKFRTFVFGECSSDCGSSKYKHSRHKTGTSKLFKTIGSFIVEGRDRICERLQEKKAKLRDQITVELSSQEAQTPLSTEEEEEETTENKKSEKRNRKHKIEIGMIENDGVPIICSKKIKFDNKKGVPLITAKKIVCYFY